MSAADASLLEVQKTFYGDGNDISSVGILGPDTTIQIPPEPPLVQEPSKPITISEIMYGSEPSFTPPQWIEIYNNGSEPINMTGWKLVVQNVDAVNLDGPLTATIVFEDEFWGEAPRLWANDFLLIVVDDDENSGGFMDDQIFSLRWRGGLDISFWDTFLSGNGFLIQLIDKDGNLVDQAGNSDGSQKVWDLPYDYNRGRTRAGNRTSLIRLYDNDEPFNGILASSWVSAADANLPADQLTYYGDVDDISSVGIGIIDTSSTVSETPDSEQTIHSDSRNAFESSTPSGYTRVTLSNSGTVWGVPAKYTTDSNVGKVTYMLLAKVKECDFATAELARQSKVYIKTQSLGRLNNYQSETVCGISSSTWSSSWNGVRITHLRFFDESRLSNINEAIYNSSTGQYELTSAPTRLKEDVNKDGVVNILDLVSVANNFGQQGENIADINGDSIVNILDLVAVAGAFGQTASAPSLRPKDLSMLTATEVKKWLSQAQQVNLTDATSLRGIQFLQQLLAALTPKETALLHNYPNPFNPETWIPYKLAKHANVTITIYAVNGTLVRRLPLGQQAAGMYQSRSRAAHWDGKNEFGEKVASGVYFYSLTAGDFSATRKMLIRK